MHYNILRSILIQSLLQGELKQASEKAWSIGAGKVDVYSNPGDQYPLG